MPLTTYYFANAGNSSAGGAYFTTNSSGLGPNDGARYLGGGELFQRHLHLLDEHGHDIGDGMVRSALMGPLMPLPAAQIGVTAQLIRDTSGVRHKPLRYDGLPPTPPASAAPNTSSASSIREPRQMPVHGRTIDAESARHGTGVLTAPGFRRGRLDQFARALRLRRRHQGLRPSCTPRAFAAFKPALVRSTTGARSNSASAPIT